MLFGRTTFGLPSAASGLSSSTALNAVFLSVAAGAEEALHSFNVVGFFESVNASSDSCRRIRYGAAKAQLPPRGASSLARIDRPPHGKTGSYRALISYPNVNATVH